MPTFLSAYRTILFSALPGMCCMRAVPFRFSQDVTAPLSEPIVLFALKACYLVLGSGHTPPPMPSHCTLTWRSRQRKVSCFQTAFVLQRFLKGD